MARRLDKPAGLKISQLARLAGVSVPTIKHYLREGLLPRPVKTGRTMSYYDPACVDRIRQIRRLQSERFLPLSAIQKIIRSGKSIEEELALGEAMMCISEVSLPQRDLQRKEMERRTGYGGAELEKMERLGLIHPRSTARGKAYDPVDCRIVLLVRQRQEAGLPLDYSLEMMSLYRKHIRTIVEQEARLFVRRMLPEADAAGLARYIREGDKALGAFMPLIREKLVRANAEKIIASLDGAPLRVRECVRLRGAVAPAKNGGKARPAGKAGGASWKDLFRVLGEEEPGGKRAEVCIAAVSPVLSAGLGCLMKGRPEEALAHFEQARACAGVGPLSDALGGLARLARAPEAPGLFAGLDVLREALQSLETSARRGLRGEAGILASYFRGVAYAVIPDVFDTHGKASLELARVARRTTGAGRAKADAAGHVLQELGWKALRTLAEMHLEDGAHGEADKALAGLMKRAGDSFYGRWAARQRSGR